MKERSRIWVDRHGIRQGRTTLVLTSILSVFATFVYVAPAAAATAPGAPSIDSVKALVDGVKVSISPPSDDGGSTITGYQATCTASGGGSRGQ